MNFYENRLPLTFGADFNNGANSGLEMAPVPALSYSGIGGSCSGLKTESQQLYFQQFLWPSEEP